MNKPINPFRQEYLEHIEKQKDSGLSIKNYCEKYNLVTHKFSYYQAYKLKVLKSNTDKSPFASVKINNYQKSSPPKVETNVEPKINPVWLAKFLNSLLINK